MPAQTQLAKHHESRRAIRCLLTTYFLRKIARRRQTKRPFAKHYTAAKHARTHTAEPHDAHKCISTAYPPNAAYPNIHRRTLSHIVSNDRLGLATAQQTTHAPSDRIYQSRLRSTQRKALVLTLHLHQSASMRICIQASHQTPSRVTLPITTSTRPLAV